MPIALLCACGKKLTTKDEHAGKRTKCPGCGTMLDIPRTVPPEEPVEAIEVPAEPSTVQVAVARVLPDEQTPDYDDKPVKKKRRRKGARSQASSGFDPAYVEVIVGLGLILLGGAIFLFGLKAGWIVGPAIFLVVVGVGALGKGLKDLGSL